MRDSQVMNCDFSSSVTVFSFKLKLFLHLSLGWLFVHRLSCFLLWLACFFSSSSLNRLAVKSYTFSTASFLEVSLWWLHSRSIDIFFRSFAIFCQLHVHEVHLHHQKRQFRPQRIEECASVEKVESSLKIFLQVFSGYILMQ
jgi:hypothetical protein